MLGLRTTRYVIGVTIMAAHFATIAVFLMMGAARMEMSEVLQGVATVTGVAAIYVTAFVTYVANTPNKAADEVDATVSTEAFLVQFVIVLVFCVALIGLPIWIFITGQLKYEDASLYTGAIDTVFAAYLGIIFKKLFPFAS